MGNVAAHPLRRCGRPAYPDKLRVLADPHLLEKHVPPGWLSNREIAALVGVLLAANAGGCAEKPAGGGPNGNSMDPRLDKVAIVAPVFAHGEGQGWGRFVLIGAVEAMPVHSAEEDALQVIREELALAGLQMSEENAKLSCVVIKGRELRKGYEWASGKKGLGFVDVTGPLQVDLEDPARRVAVEYVADADFDRLGGNDAGKSRMDIKGVAASVAAEVQRQGHGVYFGAFYDPVVFWGVGGPRYDPNDPTKMLRAESKSGALRESKRLLRLQVKDFVDWLKGQGAI